MSNYSIVEKKSLDCVQMTDLLPLQEFNSSPQSALKRMESMRQHHQPPDVTSTATMTKNQPDGQHNVLTASPSIPEPPPPPKNQPPTTLMNVCNQTGILRPHGAPTTPGTMKKRVQIQEISV